MICRKLSFKPDKSFKPDAIFRAVSNQLAKIGIEIDAVLDGFDDSKETGELMKIYEKYKPNLDVCIWVYVPSYRVMDNTLNVVVGTHSDCLDNNLWDSTLDIKSFENNRAIKLHREVRDYIIDIITSHIDKFYKIRKEDKNEI